MPDREVVRAALSKQPADLVFKNASVVDVFCRRIRKCDVAIQNGIIAGLGEDYHGTEERDVEGLFLLPGLINSHVHIESSLVTPYEYARAVLPKGVTTVIADPHEIANVCGGDGIGFMFGSAQNTPLEVYFMFPSCVPATPYDHSGAELNAEAVRKLSKNYPFHGLGEMMNTPGLLEFDPDVWDKLSVFPRIDGHAPQLHGKPLCGYIASGVSTDHECETPEEMVEKISLGMYVLLREGTSAKNLRRLVPGITPATLRRVLFCTDDRDINDILENGTISNCIATAIECGIDPIDAITIATLNAAECYGLQGKGAVAPGYQADLILSRDLSLREINAVYKKGVPVAEKGRTCYPLRSPELPEYVLKTVTLPRLSVRDFDFPWTEGTPAIQVLPHSLVTKKCFPESVQGLNRCVVIERYGRHQGIGTAFVKDFGLHGGAIAQTIGHDSHNITVLGDDPVEMFRAVSALAPEGGIAVSCHGNLFRMPLPIAGLMSDQPAEIAAAQHAQIKQMVREISGNLDIDPLMLLAFLSLVVIPELKVNDSGLFDVTEQKYL